MTNGACPRRTSQFIQLRALGDLERVLVVADREGLREGLTILDPLPVVGRRVYGEHFRTSVPSAC